MKLYIFMYVVIMNLYVILSLFYYHFILGHNLWYLVFLISEWVLIKTESCHSLVVYVCVCVCGVVVVSWAQGPWSWVQAQLRQFFHLISICLLPAPPVHPAVIGYLAFAGVQIQGLFSWSSNGPGGTSGAHTTCCEERSVLLRVPSPAPGALLARLTVLA